MMLLLTGEQTFYEHKRANEAEKFLCKYKRFNYV